MKKRVFGLFFFILLILLVSCTKEFTIFLEQTDGGTIYIIDEEYISPQDLNKSRGEYYISSRFSPNPNIKIFKEGTKLTFLARPEEGYIVGEWFEAEESYENSNKATKIVSGDSTVRAKFINSFIKLTIGDGYNNVHFKIFPDLENNENTFFFEEDDYVSQVGSWCPDCSDSVVSTSNNTVFIKGDIRKFSCSDSHISSIEFKNLKKLEILKLTSDNIKSLDLSSFSELEEFSFVGNNLKTLDLSSLSRLQKLTFDGNALEAIYLNSRFIDEITISNVTKLEDLDLSFCPSLREITLNNCSLSSFNLKSLNNLNYVTISNCNIPSIDLSSCPSLMYVSICNNVLNSLDVSNCRDLETLEAYDNNLISLNINSSFDLRNIKIYNNNISANEFVKILKDFPYREVNGVCHIVSKSSSNENNFKDFISFIDGGVENTDLKSAFEDARDVKNWQFNFD